MGLLVLKSLKCYRSIEASIRTRYSNTEHAQEGANVALSDFKSRRKHGFSRKRINCIGESNAKGYASDASKHMKNLAQFRLIKFIMILVAD